MRKITIWKRSLLIGLTAGLVGLLTGVAFAGVVSYGPADLRVVQTESFTGLDSGWHTHPGPVIVQVQEGFFKMYQGRCTPVVVQAGESFLEVPLVPIRAVAVGHIKWTTSQILPHEAAPSTGAADPCV